MQLSATGVDDIVALCDKLRTSRDFFVQLVHSGILDIKHDQATGRWILREVAKGPGEVYYNNFSLYEDVMEKQSGKWYFVRRDYKYMFLDSDQFPGKVYPGVGLLKLSL